jgi:cysteinyl-tRNA synthetase
MIGAMLTLGGQPLPLVGPARMYVCGITPYDVTHLGHAATFVWADALARVVRHTGAGVEVCRNVTDVDDVMLAAARRAGTPYDRLAAVQQHRFEQDMTALRVRPPEHAPRAHTHVPRVIRLAEALVALDRAYVRDGTVYFRGKGVVERAGLGADAARELAQEYGDEPGDPAKEDPADVAVWRSSAAVRGDDGNRGGARVAPGAEGPEPAWESPWGPGRPGWHAECAAMATATFGPSIDLHAGGVDLRFPHHAYEAAMAEAVTGVVPFARRWLHVGTVRVGGAKMAKSAGNLVLVEDLLKRWPAPAVRLMLLDRSYADHWDYDETLLAAASDRLERLYAAAGRPGGDAGVAEVDAALTDDLDVPRALAVAETEGAAAARAALTALDLL